MRRLFTVAVLFLLAMPFVSAQAICGNNDVEGFEQCDGTDATNCLNSICNVDCTCTKEAEFVLFDLALGHNLLFSKVMDLLHIVKDLLFQLELKTIEITLTDFQCSEQPVSFWEPSSASPYGKLNEIDSLDKLQIQSMNKVIAVNPTAFGSVGAVQTASAQGMLVIADSFLATNEFRSAFNCKCLAYKTLQGVIDSSVTCVSP